jgi:hypothetical protein
MFGIEQPIDSHMDHDMTKGFFPPEHPDLPISGCRKPVEKVVPVPPPIKPAERICGMLNAVIPTTDCPSGDCGCNSCDNQVEKQVENEETHEEDTYE